MSTIIHDLRNSTCIRRDGKILLEIAEADVIRLAENPLCGESGPLGPVIEVRDREQFLDEVADRLTHHAKVTHESCETWVRLAVRQACTTTAEEERGARVVPLSEALHRVCHEEALDLPGILSQSASQ